MARPLRIEYSGAWYHVTCRAIEKSVIFHDDHDHNRFLNTLRDSLELYHIGLHSFVLMPNHFHLILRILQPNLSRFMQQFNTGYTTYFNLRHKRKGHLYQGRYKAILVEADNYLLELSRYIHLNPVRIKKYTDTSLQEKIRILQDYCWSSYPGYIQPRFRTPIVNHSQVLDYVGGDNKAGRRNYNAFVLKGLTSKLDNPLREAKENTILGSESFTDWVRTNFLDKIELKPKEHGYLKTILKPIPTQQIAKAVADEYNLKPEIILKSRSPFIEARHLLIELCYQANLKRKNMRDMGCELGGISGAQVGRIHKLVKASLQNGSHNQLQEKIARLLKIIVT